MQDQMADRVGRCLETATGGVTATFGATDARIRARCHPVAIWLVHKGTATVSLPGLSPAGPLSHILSFFIAIHRQPMMPPSTFPFDPVRALGMEAVQARRLLHCVYPLAVTHTVWPASVSYFLRNPVVNSYRQGCITW